MAAGIVVGAAVVLAVAGVAKMARPDVTVGALRAAGLPPGLSSRSAATILGFVELLIGAVTAVWTTLPSVAAVVCVYLGFTLFALHLLRRGEGRVDCGCFGRRDAPIGVEHVLVDLVVVVVGVAAIVGGHDDVDPAVAAGSTLVLLGSLAVLPAFRTRRRGTGA